MEISMSSQVEVALKTALTKAGKSAARFVVHGFGCRGPLFEIELSERKDDDVSASVNGIMFVAKSAYAVALKSPEVVKLDDKFIVKRTACGC